MGAELDGGMGELTDWTKGADGASEDRFALLWRRIKDHSIAQWTVGYVAVAYRIQHAVTLTSEAFEWPVTWQTNGTQYLAVVSGIGGTDARQPDPNLAHVPKGGMVTAFKLLPQ